MNCRILAVLLMTACATASPRNTRPSTGEGILAAWLDAYNTGNVDTLREFAHAHFDSAALARRPSLARAESDRWLFLNLGTMRIVQLDSITDSSVTALVFQGLPEGWGHVRIRFTASRPRRIIARDVSFFEPPPLGHVQPAMTDSMIAADLDGFAQRLAAAGVFSGAFGVLHNGTPIIERAYGMAHRDPDGPNRLETRFALASVSKMFTSIAIAQLVQQGKLSYEDTVARVLPDYPNREVARRLTVGQLLTHTSGLPEYLFHPSYRTGSSAVRSLRDYWQFFAADSLRFPPGSQWEYSSSNYILLGGIVEHISGQDFYDYVRRHVLVPAGMASTTYDVGVSAPRATPYTRFGPDRRPDLIRAHAVLDTLDARGSPAGGGLSTIHDLLAFTQALLDHRLLNASTLDTATKPRVPTGEGTTWTYGFESQTWTGVPFFGHNGFAGGTFNQVDIFPTTGYAVVVLSNTDMSGAGALAYRARLLLTTR